MQTESQKIQLRQQQGMKEVFFDGGSVVIPVEKELLYHEVLKDKWIDGYRIYIENGAVKTQKRTDTDVMSLDTMEALLIEQNHKIYAMAGRF